MLAASAFKVRDVVTVEAKLASSPSAAASSFRVSRAEGAPSKITDPAPNKLAISLDLDIYIL